MSFNFDSIALNANEKRVQTFNTQYGERGKNKWNGCSFIILMFIFHIIKTCMLILLLLGSYSKIQMFCYCVALSLEEI